MRGAVLLPFRQEVGAGILSLLRLGHLLLIPADYITDLFCLAILPRHVQTVAHVYLMLLLPDLFFDKLDAFQHVTVIIHAFYDFPLVAILGLIF